VSRTGRRDPFDAAAYDQRWQQLEAAGLNPHGEADLVASFNPATVLDGGCGTGRVAIELARRGIDVVGVDLDADMLAVARTKAPELPWVHADLSRLDLHGRFDVIVLAGNVVAFVEPDRRAAAVTACARHLHGGGRLVAGFQLHDGGPSLEAYDAWCDAAGLRPEGRLATWEGEPFRPGGAYAISIHRGPPLTGQGP
jgi:SAM-dependent methyltransferase